MARLLARRDERGIGIVTALMVALVVFAVGGLWVNLSVHQAEESTLERAREAARHAAEAGINRAMSELATSASYAGGGGLQNLTDGTTVVAQYEIVSVTQPGADPNTRYIVARGWAPTQAQAKSRRRLEAQVQLVPSDGFRYALYAAPGGIATSNNLTVTGDVYSDTDLSLSNNAKVTGSITSQGSVTTSNNSTIGGDIRAVGNITLNNSSTTVTGSVYSNGNISLTGTVKGNAQATGTITGGTVNGTRSPASPPTPPPNLSLPTFTWNPANYTSPSTWATPAAFNTYFNANKNAFSGVHRVLCPSCSASSDVLFSSKWTMSGDVTIVTDGPIELSKDISNGSGGPVTLTIISLFPTDPAIDMTSNMTLPGDISVLLYAPDAQISFKNLKHFSGAVYGESLSSNNQFSLNWVPIAAPGFTWDLASSTHFQVQSVSFKEVQFS
jgi:hypothetical protein